MSAVPKHRASHMRQGKRRRVLVVSQQQTVLCHACGKPKLSHQACRACGAYAKAV